MSASPRTPRDVRFGRIGGSGGPVAHLLAVALLGCLILPVVALVLAGSPAALGAGLRDPALGAALLLSLRTTLFSLTVVLVTGTPLAWWLARSSSRARRLLEPWVELPIVLPPAVLGVALLDAFGRGGLFGPALSAAGVQIPFTTAAVVLAQVVVAAPFYVQSAAAAFREVDDDLLMVARTLGASPARAFRSVAVPAALPGLVSGAALCWARAVGEFGATLLFAGSLPGRTRTLPLAIYTALETDLDAARATAVVLALVAVGVLLLLRLSIRVWSRRLGRGGGAAS
ncbi:MAG: ABC transporter permease [Gemmatimonadota bacterium]